MRILIGIIAFAIWTAICVQWYVCGIKELCKCKQIEEPVSGNLLFYVSDEVPLLNDTSFSLRDSLVNQLQSNPESKLQIIGQFYSKEENNTKFSDLGLARANKVIDTLFSSLDSTLYILKSEVFEPDNLNDQKLFRAVGFKLIKNIEPSMVPVDKITIYFPYNESEASLEEDKVDSLKMIATETKKGKYIVVIEGHTDSKGAETYNLTLGQLRADWVKNLLLSYGADGQLIKLKSYGETKPVESNKSDNGRRMNRRVIVTPEKK